VPKFARLSLLSAMPRLANQCGITVAARRLSMIESCCASACRAGAAIMLGGWCERQYADERVDNSLERDLRKPGMSAAPSWLSPHACWRDGDCSL
jgi:hypothetical protein